MVLEHRCVSDIYCTSPPVHAEKSKRDRPRENSHPTFYSRVAVHCIGILAILFPKSNCLIEPALGNGADAKPHAVSKARARMVLGRDTRSGYPYDNGAMENLFGTLKIECLYRSHSHAWRKSNRRQRSMCNSTIMSVSI